MIMQEQNLSSRKWVIEAAHSVMMQGAGLEPQLEKLRKNQVMTAQDKAFAQHLLRLMLKNKTRYDALLQQFLRQNSELPNLAMLILYAGIAQIHQMQVPNYAAVNLSVELAKYYKLGKIAGLVNAVLKKSAGATLPEADLVNAPAWLQSRLTQDYGEECANQIWGASLADINYVDLSFKHELANMEGVHIAGQNLRIFEAGKINELQGYAEGNWWVQDLAASLPVFGVRHLLNGAKVIDLCAAPGGKTMQLASFGAEVVAVDRSKKRLELLAENLQRTKLKAQIQHADLLKQYQGATYDLVVLDAPCSATGTLRRNPDILYQLKDDDVAKLCAMQAELLQVAATMVAGGGYLLYVVCSLFKAEGEEQIAGFLQENQDFRLVKFDLPDWVLNDAGQMRSLPFFQVEQGGMDGFFASLLQRV